ncbi:MULTISPECIES: D-aminoacyl-tRNA deacylase [Thermodesulfovibrio]|uniref:D-aminoacyl-tRNA deacylase n=1 Tax=Thermodesulfovibrio yellowstonii (strain ATCC 51303 / DSM 11347 / YP87) TaxID=289376 RepID=DTD_THEYD|nr:MULTISPECIES: D-aminoacyl-tRNA deacylase [Thermodesulfovibrio]B5YJ89.1 RecName: Full=D-aminoacyl-tRNA deacylase; Short=DTD; AltName: Full=Gly-tRNA(Ala) deacylase [Thermodesulfovibrio yellowstonii DSM 11347]ACI20274.1 D-tyrosyl-tRNA(Tyr) deacylase [Thermodesulfovibrio yellowstonii DSM 11347]
MIALLQRVNKASVEVGGETISEIGKGILIFLGIDKKDSKKDVEYLADKVVNLRIFEDNNSKMNLSIKDVGGEIMVVSEFTLAGDCKKGNRPSFDKAMPPEEAEKLYRDFIDSLRSKGIPVKEGVFRSFMHVSLINEGPVTFILNTR